MYTSASKYINNSNVKKVMNYVSLPFERNNYLSWWYDLSHF